MAQIDINKLLEKFQGELGRLTGQNMINQAQIEADQEETVRSLSERDEKIQKLKDLLNTHGIDHSAITGEKTGEAVVRGIAEGGPPLDVTVEDGPAPEPRGQRPQPRKKAHR